MVLQCLKVLACSATAPWKRDHGCRRFQPNAIKNVRNRTVFSVHSTQCGQRSVQQLMPLVTRWLLLSASLPAHSFCPLVAVAEQRVDLKHSQHGADSDARWRLFHLVLVRMTLKCTASNVVSGTAHRTETSDEALFTSSSFLALVSFGSLSRFSAEKQGRGN